MKRNPDILKLEIVKSEVRSK